ncbi:hypothetical protein FRC04_004154 [Tulasnella sp. 424]|nr:hypothetical protein FRC04_004154 [Tulasnella sp. 424]KAG8968896.1 hypothetical protein FRC05_001264 [Tulasnella sp. 425]
MNRNSTATTRNSHNQTSIIISEVKYKKDTTHWYADGNLIVLVENTAFRVFQSFLTRRSGVMDAALAVPQSKRLNNPESPVRIRRDTFDGASVVELDDNTLDVGLLLDVVLPQTCATSPISTQTEWTRLLGLAQIAQKYAIADVVSQVIDILEKVLPTRQRPYGACNWSPVDAVRIIHWARDCGFHQFLPMAFYYLATGEWEFDTMNWEAMESLSTRDQLRVQQGLARLQTTVVKLALSRWENHPIGNSKPAKSCPNWRYNCWMGYGGKVWSSGDDGTRWSNLLLHPLEELQLRANGKVANLDNFCDHCRTEFIAASNQMSDDIVKELLFGDFWQAPWSN